MALSKKQFFIFLAIYAASRIFSFYFPPRTPLHPEHLLNTIASALILLSACYLLAKRDERGWYIVMLELVLGGAGGLFSLLDFSLRTWLLLFSLGIFAIRKFQDGQLSSLVPENRPYSYVLALLYTIVIIAALRGYFFNHDPHLIASEIIPYLFFLYYYPLKELLGSEKFRAFATVAVVAAIAGNVLFMLLTFFGLSFNSIVIPGVLAGIGLYYHWFRDAALGKITALPFNFYRIVLNEHLLLVPVLLWMISPIIINRNKQSNGGQRDINMRTGVIWLSASALLIVLTLNLSRIYLIALATGFLLYFSRTYWRRWLAGGLIGIVIFIFSFTFLHLIASRGQSLGWEVFGIRLQSIVSPELEDSSLSRLLLLPKILAHIERQPLIGNGLGDTVTVYSPVEHVTITTAQFDWGYLQIADELGAAGLLIWLLFIYLIVTLIRKVDATHRQAYYSSLTSLLVINLTFPALFHVLGAIFLAFLAISATNKL